MKFLGQRIAEAATNQSFLAQTELEFIPNPARYFFKSSDVKLMLVAVYTPLSGDDHQRGYIALQTSDKGKTATLYWVTPGDLPDAPTSWNTFAEFDEFIRDVILEVDALTQVRRRLSTPDHVALIDRFLDRETPVICGVAEPLYRCRCCGATLDAKP